MSLKRKLDITLEAFIRLMLSSLAVGMIAGLIIAREVLA